MSIKLLRQKRADLVAEGNALITAANDNGGIMTDEQKARDDAIQAELEQVNDGIMRAERAMERERSAPALARGRDELDASHEDWFSRVPTERRALLLGPDGRAQPDIVGYQGRPFRTFSEQLFAIVRAANDPRNTDSRLVMAATGANENIASDGGFLVQVDFANEMLRRMYEFGAILNRVRKIPISGTSNGLKINGIDETSRVAGSRWGGVRSYWIGEADQYTATRPKFRQLQLDLKKLIGLCYVTDELLQDGAAMESWITQAFTEELTFKTEDAVINGTGAGMPLGLLSAPATVSVAKETGQLAATIELANVLKMWSRMWGPSRANAIWLINQDTEPQLNQMSLAIGTGGVPVYLPPGGLSETPFARLLGRPVIPVEYCATLGTVGDILLVNLDEYLMIDKGGIQQASSVHLRFDYGEQVFRFTYRADGSPTWHSALTPHKGTNTLSPFVSLATRA